jgi:hypothetical protein
MSLKDPHAMDPKEACAWLHSLGFSMFEIKHLMLMRQKYASLERPHLVATLRHLEFLRWLFVTGKLRD